MPTVAVGLYCHARLGALAGEVKRDLSQTVVPMGVGSVVGAVAGGLMFGLVPSAALKLVLGVILIFSAVKGFRR